VPGLVGVLGVAEVSAEMAGVSVGVGVPRLDKSEKYGAVDVAVCAVGNSLWRDGKRHSPRSRHAVRCAHRPRRSTSAEGRREAVALRGAETGRYAEVRFYERRKPGSRGQPD